MMTAKKVAVLGTGLMGVPIARRLAGAGHHVLAFNRTPSKAGILKKDGISIAGTAAEAVSKSECIILTLADYNAIQGTIISGKEIELSRKTVIQMGTIAPGESVDLGRKVAERGGVYIECPVLGSRKEAGEGTLILMVGTDREVFQQWQDFFKVLGPKPLYVGEAGKAAALKLAVNHLIAAHAVSFSLSIGLIEKNGVDIDIFSEVLRKSSLYAPMYDKKLPNWQKRDYTDPNFPTKHLLKDVALILKEAEDKGLLADVLRPILGVARRSVESGYGELDYSSVFNTINNIKK